MKKYETTNYAGIDYGRGMANVDNETGIRYGVIPHHEIGEIWYDESEPDYGDQIKDIEDRIEFLEKEIDDAEEDEDTFDMQAEVDDLQNQLDNHIEALGFYYKDEATKMYQSYDDHDIFVTKSAWYTHAQFCSPCAPGACYLKSPLDHINPNNMAYCPGPDWFEDGEAPYPIYPVTK